MVTPILIVVQVEKKKSAYVILSRSGAQTKNLAPRLSLHEILRPAASE